MRPTLVKSSQEERSVKVRINRSSRNINRAFVQSYPVFNNALEQNIIYKSFIKRFGVFFNVAICFVTFRKH